MKDVNAYGYTTIGVDVLRSNEGDDKKKVDWCKAMGIEDSLSAFQR